MMQKHLTVCCFVAAMFAVGFDTSAVLAKKPHGEHSHGAHSVRHRGGSGFGHVSIGPYGIGVGSLGKNFGITVGPFLTEFVDGNGVFPGAAFSESSAWLAPPVSYGFLEAPMLNVPALSERTVIPTSLPTNGFQLLAETAFRQGAYDKALKWSQHAVLDEPQNGRLHLYISQILVALGDYPSAATSLQAGISHLSPLDWGYVVEHRGRLYANADYALHLDRLSRYVAEHPRVASALLLRGHQYLFLGHVTAARGDLSKAAALEDARAANAARRLLGRLEAWTWAPAPTVPHNAPPAELLPTPEPRFDGRRQ